MPNKGASKKKAKPKRPRCHTCGKPIHIPAGWSAGPAVRRHYWKHHPARMRAAAPENQQ